MIRIEFLEECTVYPDGKEPKRYLALREDDFEDDYANLLVRKGHAKFAKTQPVVEDSSQTLPAGLPSTPAAPDEVAAANEGDPIV
jgi:hypothetical protein